jgi:hypothetical protein
MSSTRCGAVIRLWDNAWEEFVPLLDYVRSEVIA